MLKHLSMQGRKNISCKKVFFKDKPVKIELTKLVEQSKIDMIYAPHGLCPNLNNSLFSPYSQNFLLLTYKEWQFGLYVNDAQDFSIFIEPNQFFRVFRRLYQDELIVSAKTEDKNSGKTAPIMPEHLFRSLIKETLGYIDVVKKSPYKLKYKRGIILQGNPGNGKTMFCRHLKYLAKKAGLTFDTYTGDKILGAHTDALIQMFNKSNITVFDDVDIAIFSHKRTTKTVDILSAMDGIYQGTDTAIRIFTTNENVKDMDPAFRRPGRIDKIFEIKAPSLELIKKFIYTWEPEAQEIISEYIDELTGYNFAQLDEIRNSILCCIISDEVFDFYKVIEWFETETNHFSGKKVGFNGGISQVDLSTDEDTE